MSGTDKSRGVDPSDVERSGEADKHTDRGAPTDELHRDAGDGSLTGSTPAGLTVDELLDQANSGQSDDGGAG